MGSSVALCLLALASQLADPMGGGTQPGELTTPLASNGNCQVCHRSDTDPNMAASSYRGTMMDLAGVDPIFLAALEVASNDAPAAAELCIKCHFPRAWLDGRTNGTAEDGFGLLPDDLQGIQCDYCHRMAVPPPTSPSSITPPPALSGVLIANAQIFVNDSATKHGPLGSTFATGHSSAYSPLFEDSVLCAQCHDVSNTFLERINDEGEGLGVAVPIERTYSEWRASAYADPTSPDHKGCMDCHMQPYTGFAAKSGSVPERELKGHKLVGGNTIAPLMVAHLYDGNASAPGFLQNLGPDVAATVEAARAQLQKAAALEALELIEKDGGHALRVRLTNLTGHKLPTGYAEGRRMWIAHEVRFPDGTKGPRTGTPDEDTWDFVPGEEPLRAYEVLLSEGLSEQHSFHFALVNRLLKDNRIPPKGFRPEQDTPILGHVYPEEPDGSVVHYDELDLPLGENDCWPAIAKVRLYFQASSGTYLRFLIDNAPVYGPDLEAAFAAVGAPAEVMEELEVAVFPDGRIEPAGFHLCEPAPVVTPLEPDAGPPVTPPVFDGGDGDGDDGDVVACGCASAVSTTDLCGVAALLWLGVLARRRRRQRRR